MDVLAQQGLVCLLKRANAHDGVDRLAPWVYDPPPMHCRD